MPINQSSKQYTTTYQGSAAPDKAGFITLMAGASLPNGWLYCDGSAVSRTTYSELFAAIGTTYGVGNGSTTFNLPSISIVIDGITRQYIIKPYSDITSAASVGLSTIGGAIFNTFGDFTLQSSSPASPGSGDNRLYFKTDGNLYKKSSAGVETQIGGSTSPGVNTISSTGSPAFVSLVSNSYNLIDTSLANGNYYYAQLPTEAAGLVVYIKDKGGNAPNVPIYLLATNNIDGVSGVNAYVMRAAYESITVVCDGTDWFII